MSRWRVRGFVQDSDEEEEELDTLSTNSTPSSPRTETLRDASLDQPPSAQHDVEASAKVGNGPTVPTLFEDHVENATGTPTRLDAENISTSSHPPEHTASPDPLRSPTPPTPQPTLPDDTLTKISVLAPAASQDSSESQDPLVKDIFTTYLEDDCSSLSDPPSDDNEDGNTHLNPPEPQQRQTVQVVIPPPSTKDLPDTVTPANRSLRTRKPIQVHPYLLEYERYRQECQRRGIKPVARPKSPSRPRHHDAETQELDFDPEHGSPPDTPPLPASTAPVGHRQKNGRRKSSLGSPATIGLMARANIFPRLDSAILPRTQPDPHYALGRKRRKLNPPLASTGGHIFDFPESTPESSDPMDVERRQPLEVQIPNGAEVVPTLPTPSNSSLMDMLHPVPDSDSDDDGVVPPSTRRSNRFRPVVVSSEDSEPNSAASDGDSESEVEVRRISKKIKGVLPASWLRLDQKAQQKRKELARERSRTIFSPERVEVPRGIAQRTVKPSNRPRRPSASDEINAVEISDGSGDDDTTPSTNELLRIQEGAHEASTLAAILDSRYAEDEDLDGMENDRLHLFTLGGGTRKRKGYQAKLTDAFHKSKKPKRASHRTGNSKLSGLSRTGPSHDQSHRYGSRTGGRGSTPPALSIIDGVNTFTRASIPQFVRVAMRRASKRPDKGRGSPSQKHIKLTSRDTEDANFTLREWRSGAIKPKSSPASRSEHRQPLKDLSTNQQLSQSTLTSRKDVPAGQHTQHKARIGTTQERQCDSRSVISFRQASEHASAANISETVSTTSKKKASRKPCLPGPVFRTAQLEGLESEYGRSLRNIMFQRGLQRANKEFAQALPRWEPSHNIQLARYLAEEDTFADLPKTTENARSDHDNAAKPAEVKPRRRIRRKPQAQRMDVDVREYRQPSEPAPIELVDNASEPQEEHRNATILEGLAPFGMAYSSTFDVSPLAMGTYFSSETFIGGDGLSKALNLNQRDLDKAAGYYSFGDGTEHIQCGPWTDQTFSRIQSQFDCAWGRSHEQTTVNGSSAVETETTDHVSRLLRSLISYFTSTLSFLDAIDRQDFATRMRQLLESQFTNLVELQASIGSSTGSVLERGARVVRPMAYVLVLGTQLHSIAQHPIVEFSIRMEVADLIRSVSKALIQCVISKGVPALGRFLESNKMYKEREGGIKDKDVLVECVVICMHTLNQAGIANSSFWDLASQQLSLLVGSTTQVKRLESVWATAFTLLPFFELDTSGVVVVNQRSRLTNENWMFVKDIVNRVFQLYPASSNERSLSINEYLRATLRRCHTLIETWHWKRCGPILIAVFDFFGKNGLKQLRREDCKRSPRFLEQLDEVSTLTLDPGDTAFQIFLKCLGSGLLGMRKANVEEKKIRSIVFRCTPNHGRSYPKDQSLDQESLDALRNHHDLLCTLYWASPPSCRPKLSLLRGLVHHENSHREACRLNIRSWTNLTMFQLSVDEPYSSLQPFAQWHRDIMRQTLKQYRLAKSEAEDYLKIMQQQGDGDISAHMVRRTVAKNQEQVLASLRDCLIGMKRAIRIGTDRPCLKDFLVESGVVELLEVNVDDSRLSDVIRDALSLIREYVTLQNSPASDDSQPQSEESQDYGDFPDIDDLAGIEPQVTVQPPLEFIQTPLWHLLSNVFGAERSSDDNVLMESVDTWVQVAAFQVFRSSRSWSYYLDSFSPASWYQLRDTEQTRRLKPYFMAKVYMVDQSAYDDHETDFINTLLVSLVERDSKLRYQNRLLHAMLQSDEPHPLLRNLPFSRDARTGAYDITIDAVKERRLSLLSSILANMQEDYHNAKHEGSDRAAFVKREYALLLNNLMTAMKSNYQQLHQGTKITGAYVTFVQAIVQFLNQYISDICTVNPFFTDSAEFPLPAADPTYVVGRLCGYAPKLGSPGVTKQLSTFMQIVAQQAAKDNHGEYLVRQLSTALTNDDGRTVNKPRLRSVLLQGIIPAYIEASFASVTGSVIAKPILRSLKGILDTLQYDLQIYDASNVENICSNIFSILTAFVRATATLTMNPTLLSQPHILQSTALILDAMTPALSTLEYIIARNMPGPSPTTPQPAIISHISAFTTFVTEIIQNTGRLPFLPAFDVDAVAILGPHSDLLPFCVQMLKSSIQDNWTETREGGVAFGHGNARKEVLVDVGTVEEERWRVERVIGGWRGTVEGMFGVEDAEDDDVREKTIVSGVGGLMI